MKILELANGRLGNSIFRYFESIILQKKTGAVRTFRNGGEKPCLKITDDTFLDFYNRWDAERGTDIKLIFLDGYFQFDFFIQHRAEIINHMNDHSHDILFGTDVRGHLIQNTVRELTHAPDNLRTYDFVIHVRLEDFVNSNNMIHPAQLVELITEVARSGGAGAGAAAIVCNKITTDIEKQYLQYISDYSPITFVLESNDVMTDFHIMKNARILICSLSSLSWCASFLSNTVKKVYIPKNRTSGVQTFLCSRPDCDVIVYDNVFCNRKDLQELAARPR
jgi:hypothetical protein